MFEKLKTKWGIKSNWDVVAILIVFAISGSSIMFVKPVWFKIFGVTDATQGWLKFIIWVAMVFPTYQAFLLIYGFILGQFKFFWDKEVKMAQAIVSFFKKRAPKQMEGVDDK